MDFGKLDREITIQEGTESTNDDGDNVTDWSDFAEVWASRQMISMDERYLGEKLTLTEAYKYRCRYVEGVTTNMRLVDDNEGGGTYDIVAADPVGRKTFLELRVIAKD